MYFVIKIVIVVSNNLYSLKTTDQRIDKLRKWQVEATERLVVKIDISFTRTIEVEESNGRLIKDADRKFLGIHTRR